MWPSLYGHQTVQCKLKKGLKTHKKSIFSLFQSLHRTAWWPYRFEPHQCSLIYPTNPSTNPWNFWEKILRFGGIEKLLFESANLNFWFSKIKFFASSPRKSFKISKLLMITLVSSKFLAMHNITLYSVNAIMPGSRNVEKYYSEGIRKNADKRKS